MTQLDLIVSMIESTHDKIDRMDENVKVVLNDHEERLRASEKTLGKVRTIGGALAALTTFFGWETVKNHWPTFLK